MTISSKDKYTIDCLLKIGKRIQRLYDCAKSREDLDIISSRLLVLIDKESSLIGDINLTKEKYERIKDYLIDRCGMLADTNLLFGYSPNLEHTNYPFYRLVAKMKEYVTNHEPDLLEEVDYFYLNTLVEILYRCLVQAALSKNNDDILLDYAYNILMDSSEIEQKMLTQNLEPSESIVNGTDLALTLWGLKKIKVIKERLDIEDDIQFNSDNRQYLSTRFNNHYQELTSLTQKYVLLRNPNLITDSIYRAYIEYLKALIAMMPKKERESIYNVYLTSSQYERQLIIRCAKDIEMSIIPSIEYISTKKMQ